MSFVPFALEHLKGFEPNKYCKSEAFENTLGNPACEKYTMLDEAEKPVAFVFFVENAPTEFLGYFMIAAHFDRKHCVPLRDFVKHLVKQRGRVTKVWTVSRQLPELESWHRFLGLQQDGTMVLNNATYDVWSMAWA